MLHFYTCSRNRSKEQLYRYKNRRKYIKQILEELLIPSKDIVYLNSTFDYGNTLYTLKMHHEDRGKFEYDTVIALNDEMAFACLDFCKQIGKKSTKRCCSCRF